MHVFRVRMYIRIVCVGVCAYVCMDVHMYIFLKVFMHICVDVCVACLHACENVCTTCLCTAAAELAKTGLLDTHSLLSGVLTLELLRLVPGAIPEPCVLEHVLSRMHDVWPFACHIICKVRSRFGPADMRATSRTPPPVMPAGESLS